MPLGEEGGCIRRDTGRHRKGDRHASEGEPVPVPLGAEADAAGGSGCIRRDTGEGGGGEEKADGESS